MGRFKGLLLPVVLLIMLGLMTGTFASLLTTLGVFAGPAEAAPRGAGLQGSIPTGYKLVGDAFRAKVSQRLNFECF